VSSLLRKRILRISGNGRYLSLEDLERTEGERLEDLERLERSGPHTKEDLERLKRVEQWKKETATSSKPNTNNSPTEVASQSPKKRKTKKYTSSQVATAAGRAVVAVGADNLPLEAQRKALELAKRWLRELKE
jgi:hypothetical protein